MLALATIAPWLSTTAPAICPVLACDCARAEAFASPRLSANSNAQSEWNGFILDMFLPLCKIKFVTVSNVKRARLHRMDCAGRDAQRVRAVQMKAARPSLANPQ